MANRQKLTRFGTQDTGRRQTKQKNTTQKNNKDVQTTLNSIALFESAAELCPEKILCWVQALE